MNDDYGTVLSPTEVRFQRLLPGPIETVWAFLTDSKKRGEWFASGPMEPRVGGKVTLRFKHSDLSPHKAPPPSTTVRISVTLRSHCAFNSFTSSRYGPDVPP